MDCSLKGKSLEFLLKQLGLLQIWLYFWLKVHKIVSFRLNSLRDSTKTIWDHSPFFCMSDSKLDCAYSIIENSGSHKIVGFRLNSLRVSAKTIWDYLPLFSMSDSQLGCAYLNNKVFLLRNYWLIVALRKFDVLKTNICPRSEASRANMLVFRTSNFQGATIRPIVPRQKHSVVFIVHH